jgi:hypothetical protein
MTRQTAPTPLVPRRCPDREDVRRYASASRSRAIPRPSSVSGALCITEDRASASTSAACAAEHSPTLTSARPRIQRIFASPSRLTALRRSASPVWECLYRFGKLSLLCQ